MSRLAQWPGDRRGNVALIFALSLFVICMVVGAAVDLSRMASSKSRLQDATDAAVLAAAKVYYLNASKTPAERLAAAQKAADAYMNAMVDSRKPTLLAPTWVVTVDKAGVVTLVSDSASPAYFGAFFGISKLNFETTAVAMGGAPRLEIALVLDNTGSMAGNKLAELKKAATGLVGTLERGALASSIDDPLKLALVPFSMTVRVDPSAYAAAAWIDTKGVSSTYFENFSSHGKTRGELFAQLGQPWAGCLERRPSKGDYDILEKPPSASDPDSLYVPYFAPDEPDTGGEVFNNYQDDSSAGDWNARQTDIAKYQHPQQHFGTSKGGLSYKLGPNAGCEMAAIARLSANTAAVKATINDMKAVGNTDIGLGLMWGWHALSPNAPFADGKPYKSENLSKIVILMTDGNNENRETNNPNDFIYSGIGYITAGRIGITGGSASQRTQAFDDRLAKLCANMKLDDIEIYAMRVEVKGSSKVLQDCASGPDHYFEVAKAADMNAAFDQIATSILELHLSK